MKGFNLEEQKFKVIKFGKYKLEIRPYILTNEKIIISDICCQQFKNDNENKKKGSFHLARLIYNIAVASLCVKNIAIDGVDIKYKKDKVDKISLDLKDKTIENFEKSGLISLLSENICGYNETWGDIVRDIEFSGNNISEVMEKFVGTIPSGEKQEEIVREIKTIIDNFNKKNPEIAKEIAREPFAKEAKQELVENKMKEKQEKLNKKK